MKNLIKTKIAGLIVLSLVMMNVVSLLPNYNQKEELKQITQDVGENILDELPMDIQPAVTNLLEEEMVKFPSDQDIGVVLGDRDNDYTEIYQPWKSQAAIHAVSYHEDTGYLAMAGGYLYDNEVHLYRLNTETGDFDKVWVCGDGIIQSDVMAIAFGDTDLNDFLEIVAGSSDGHVYVFEQRHIYDPFTNTENMFELVWTSPSMFRVFDVKIEDADRDYRPDIIVGSWDGLYLYEYDEHSGYPFNEEHWITYRQVYHDDVDGEKIYSLESGDTNHNGLPEIVVGTREGTVFIFENDGISMEINGDYFPLIQDNAYELIWTSENYTWTPILSMDIGELDGSEGEELALIAQGQGVFSLDWNEITKTFDYKKIVRAYEDWETFGYWGLDHYVDRVISANNVTYSNPISPYFDAPEPIDYVWVTDHFEPDADCYPYNTGMSMAPDGNYSTFDASIPGVTNASAVVDFGLDEEGSGSASDAYDVEITFSTSLTTSIYSDFNFSISQDGVDFDQIFSDHFTISGNKLRIDVDDALIERKWDWFRYAKLSVFNDANYDINSLELMQVYNLLTDGLSLTIGPLRLDGQAYMDGEEEANKIVVGTVTGKYLGIQWNSAEDIYELVWDSGDDEFYAAGTGIWDLQHIESVASIPGWRFLKGPNPTNYVPMPLPPLSGDYNSWTFGNINPYFDAPNYFVGTQQSEIFAYEAFPNLPDSTVQAYLNDINNYLAIKDKPFVSVEVPLIPATGSPLPFLAVASYSPDIEPYGNDVDTYNAELNFWFRGGFSDPFSLRRNINYYDLTGEITALVGMSKTTPKMVFDDIDGDGDQDLIFTNGRLYLAKNLWVETETMNFTLIHDYFADVNSELKSNAWGQPELFDLDKDDDLDLILSYANKNGSTAFLNHGTKDKPIWRQDKRIFSNTRPETNLKFLGMTDTRIIPVGTGSTYDIYSNLYDYDDPEFLMVTYNNETHTTHWAEPVYDAIDSYIVASYPEVIRTEFSLLDSGDTNFMNFGYHVLESWSTEEDLKDWTLSITSADTDGDGKGEIIVGDYDNNVYLFENLVENNYKRMYKTFDLTHEESTTESPYLYQDLEGISGEFTRTIWDHATNLLADVDLDQDGLKEMIVTANLKAYVFEDRGLTGGDEMQFIYSIDLWDSEFVGQSGWDQVTEITALINGDDLDYNGQRELILAAGPYLFVYNVPENNYEGIEDQEYFVTSKSLEGRYDLVGNPIADSNFKYFWIDTLASGDTDQDGYKELILGGINDTRAIRKNGFVNIYECQGGTFYEVWNAPREVVYWNPITIIKLDDQDYDWSQEIIIGHSQGFDIWEHIPSTDSEYQKIEYVTSSPNYPVIELDETYAPSTTEYLWLKNEYRSDAVNCESGPYSNFILQIYNNKSDLWWKRYNKGTEEWEVPKQVMPDSSYASFIYECEPTITCTTTGRIFAVWKIVTNIGDTQFWASELNTGTGLWNTPVGIGALNTNDLLHYPSLFQMDSDYIGITFRADYDYLGSGSWIGAFSMDISSTLSYAGSGILFFDGYADFDIQSTSTTTLSDGSYATVFSALTAKNGKPDHDIYLLQWDSSGFSDSIARQITDSYTDEVFPEIDTLKSDDESLIVVYENVGVPYEDRIGIIASSDLGMTWGREHTLNTIPPDLVRTEYPEYGYTSWSYFNPRVFSPTIVGMDGEGFMYTLVWTVDVFDWSWIGDQFDWAGVQSYGINPQSDWTANQLLRVLDLDVGDTDSDGRREVIAGWEDQVGVYEMKSSTDGTDFMTYEETWLSPKYENDFTGLTVYDTKSNGFEEIAVATKRGNVFFYEFRDPSEGPVELYNSERAWYYDINYVPDSDLMKSVDVDGDGNDEIITISTQGKQVTVLKKDGSLLWADSFGSGTHTLTMDVVDLNSDGYLEICFKHHESDEIVVVSALNGSVIWTKPSTHYTPVWHIADINNDGYMEFLLAYENDIQILDYNGTEIDDLQDVCTYSIYSMQTGYYNNANVSSLAISEQYGRVSVINITDGSLIFETSEGVMNSNSGRRYEMIPIDLNEDGFEELIVGGDAIHVIDVNNSYYLHNSTYFGKIGPKIYLEDFDGDGGLEVLAQTESNGIFLEDLEGGATQWNYSPTFTIKDITIGKFGGNGLFDVIVVGDDGYTVAVDGKSGMAMWFNKTNSLNRAVVSLKRNGPFDLIASWNDLEYINVYDSTDRYSKHAPAGFDPHQLYLDFETNGDKIDQYYIEDIDPSTPGIDEILVINDGMNLNLWTSEPSVIISVQYKKTIRNVKFADLNQDGNLDFAVSFENKTDGEFELLYLDGDSGKTIATISAPTGYDIADYYFGEFNTDSENPGDECVILFEKSSGTESYLEWYDNDGNSLYKSEDTIYDNNNKIVVGYFNDLTTLDVAFGGDNDDIYFVEGGDGSHIWTHNTGNNIWDMVVGNFHYTSSSYSSIAYRYDRTITMFDIISHNTVSVTYAADTSLRSFMAGDIYQSNGYDELILNLEREGVVAYNNVGTEVWRFNAPLMVSAVNSYMIVKDMDDDGTNDLVYTNYNYLNIIDGATSKLKWHYVGSSRISRPMLGQFTSDGGEFDVTYLFENNIHIVSATDTIPLKSFASEFGETISHWYEDVGLFWIPIGMTLVIPEFLIIKKRRKAKQ
ncbi:hypothetical protein NEF87_004126 [Candidatus Lokiarchaeum ossiferum]|uniref:VCBS repeat-containing protein n=1 Tax=Candidatus Lokiarchaeum ossiferum TaxID=2951803 RepID=A0ABY6HWT4_9ARCH|nr:hypothetical protein NEF87_004126 [Candidatus Lokiarchaeum sp. B-35]